MIFSGLKMCFLLMLVVLSLNVNIGASQEDEEDTEPVRPTPDSESAGEHNNGLIGSPNGTTPERKKNTFTEQRFSKLFGTRTRTGSRPRIASPTHLVKPKPTLPSFIKNSPPARSVTFQPIQRQTVRSSPSPLVRATTPKTTPRPSSSNKRSRHRDTQTNSTTEAPSSRRRFGGTFVPKNSTRTSGRRGSN